MQVLKFGGTSVANATAIKKTKAIVEQKAGAENLVVVVSAFSGVTDGLLQCGQWALENNPEYTSLLEALTNQHVEAVKELLPVTAQSSVLSWVVHQFHEVEDICSGIKLLNEFSDRTRDRLVSYGELISSKIISAFFSSEGLTNEWLDAQKMIVTDSRHTKANVNF
ncbi:MAG TPA: hypothetical protein VM871_03545, partial [Flavisolibacter sp.]|nr:hypothetical protein [Flavisolibacter sp.]